MSLTSIKPWPWLNPRMMAKIAVMTKSTVFRPRDLTQPKTSLLRRT